MAIREHDVETFTEFISELDGYFVINGKSYPDTQPINVKHGQTVRIRLIGASEMIHLIHLHGHFFNIVAEDGRTMAQPIQKDTVQVAPGETYDLTFRPWEHLSIPLPYSHAPDESRAERRSDGWPDCLGRIR